MNPPNVFMVNCQSKERDFELAVKVTANTSAILNGHIRLSAPVLR